MATRSDLVTGEAVVVDMHPAQLATRAAAFLVDIVVMGLLSFLAILAVLVVSLVTDPALTAGVAILASVLIMIGYPVTFETLSRGRSLGKLALGLRVVGVDGGPERFRQALFRGLAGLIEFWTFWGAPALITSLISSDGKRLGDIFAGTVVISERVPGRGIQVARMPPGLETWARRLELSRLSADAAEAARQYLLRWRQLSPEVRVEMGNRVAAQIASATAPPPPPGVPPEAYVSAVLAERRRRAETTLAAQAGLAAQLRAASDVPGLTHDSRPAAF